MLNAKSFKIPVNRRVVLDKLASNFLVWFSAIVDPFSSFLLVDMGSGW